MKSTVTEKAYAKINLTLDIGKKRADGYHAVDTVMQSVDLCDILTVKKHSVINLTCDKQWLPADSKNLAFRAAESFFAYTKISGGAKIHLQKNIPVAAGLGGGSADAAAVIRALNFLYSTSLTADEMKSICVTLGADVPFCIEGGTARGTGTGNVLTRVSPLKNVFFVIAMKGEGISTPEMYGTFDKCAGADSDYYLNDTASLISALERGSTDEIIGCFSNAFEKIAVNIRPCVGEVITALREAGAKKAVMSGSGAAVFGAFLSKQKADEAAFILTQKKIYAKSCSVTE